MSTGTWDLAFTAFGAAMAVATGGGRLSSWGGELPIELTDETMMGLSKKSNDWYPWTVIGTN
jgi:hypothetical protein